jgi:glutathione S-transferase
MRERAITWMFAALNTVEPPILERETARLLEGDKTWYEERLPLVEDRVRDRLNQLSGRLGDADLRSMRSMVSGGGFSASHSRSLSGSELVEPFVQVSGQTCNQSGLCLVT